MKYSQTHRTRYAVSARTSVHDVARAGTLTTGLLWLAGLAASVSLLPSSALAADPPTPAPAAAETRPTDPGAARSRNAKTSTSAKSRTSTRPNARVRASQRPSNERLALAAPPKPSDGKAGGGTKTGADPAKSKPKSKPKRSRSRRKKAEPAAEPSDIDSRKISLEEDFLVEGKREKPNAFYILRRSQTGYDWARLDAKFLPLVLESVQDPLF